MSLKIITIPCLKDNYAYLIQCTKTNTCALIDAPEAAPILTALQNNNWKLNYILLTHHHHDHIGGVEEIKSKTNAHVWGAKQDQHRLPSLDKALHAGDYITIGTQRSEIINVYGHTIGHIAYIFHDAKAIFSGDSLMVMGCGRLFEGTHQDMWQSLQKFLTLPDDMNLYSGHEYCVNNLAFAQTIDPNNPALQARSIVIHNTRNQGGYTVPSTLGIEKQTNPFLRCHRVELKKALNMPQATAQEVFTTIRNQKDEF